MAGSRHPFAARPTLDAQPTPIPISATISIGSGTLRVVWNVALSPNPALNAANWSGRLNFFGPVNDYTVSSMAALGNETTGTVVVGGASAGPLIVNYAPPPFDVLNVTQTPAAAFTDFPITIIP